MSNDSKISLVKKLFFGSGSFGWTFLQMTLASYAIYYYAPPDPTKSTAFVPIGIAGSAMLVGRIIDSIADPTIGQWSDVVRTKWGRRMPFLIFGTPPLVLSFVLIWFPPVATTSMWNFVYLSIMFASFWFFYTVYVNPYIALIPQLGKTDKDRVDLGISYTIGMGGGMAAFSILVPILIGSIGYQMMGIIVGLFGLIALFAPPLGISEENRWKEEEEGEEKGLPFLEAIKETINNRPMAIFLVVCFSFGIILNTVMIIAPYIVDVLLRLPEEMATLFYGSLILSGIVFLPLTRKLASIWSKKRVLLIGLLITAGSLPVLAFVDLIGFLPTVPLALVLAGLNGFPIIGYYTLENAILGEIVDKDEEETGFRREGMFSGIRGLIQKLAIGLGAFGSTMIMDVYGYSQYDPTGLRIAILVLSVISLIGFVVFRKFPLEK